MSQFGKYFDWLYWKRGEISNFDRNFQTLKKIVAFQLWRIKLLLSIFTASEKDVVGISFLPCPAIFRCLGYELINCISALMDWLSKNRNYSSSPCLDATSYSPVTPRRRWGRYFDRRLCGDDCLFGAVVCNTRKWLASNAHVDIPSLRHSSSATTTYHRSLHIMASGSVSCWQS